ncbi:hypothetical protein SI65_06793 [Aspergillus cristatus]|uniref:Uncharacterized protein n=1 Tax=Aspergillus cristatus TaxID=573508 RepID=A0A1E3BAL8_ASPCR|nr:hypothetical protein SI65_06793 [Aspergillus cristatus]
MSQEPPDSPPRSPESFSDNSISDEDIIQNNETTSISSPLSYEPTQLGLRLVRLPPIDHDRVETENVPGNDQNALAPFSTSPTRPNHPTISIRHVNENPGGEEKKGADGYRGARNDHTVDDGGGSMAEGDSAREHKDVKEDDKGMEDRQSEGEEITGYASSGGMTHSKSIPTPIVSSKQTYSAATEVVDFASETKRLRDALEASYAHLSDLHSKVSTSEQFIDQISQNIEKLEGKLVESAKSTKEDSCLIKLLERKIAGLELELSGVKDTHESVQQSLTEKFSEVEEALTASVEFKIGEHEHRLSVVEGALERFQPSTTSVEPQQTRPDELEQVTVHDEEAGEAAAPKAPRHLFWLHRTWMEKLPLYMCNGWNRLETNLTVPWVIVIWEMVKGLSNRTVGAISMAQNCFKWLNGKFDAAQCITGSINVFIGVLVLLLFIPVLVKALKNERINVKNMFERGEFFFPSYSRDTW